MRKTVLSMAVALALALSGAAYANPGNNGNGNGGCGHGQQTNGCGGTTTPPTTPPGASANAGAAAGAIGVGVGYGQGGSASANGYGGQGGQGGAGGHATATGGAGGSVLASGNSANSNVNTNTAAQGQLQGQLQGQVATGGAAHTGDVASSNTLSGTQANGQTVTVEGSSTVYQAQERNPVSTAYAGPLTASNGTCMGSTTVGGQGITVGVSFGTTWKDGDCNARYNADYLAKLGQPKAAIARMCQLPDVEAAMKAAGTPCPGGTKTAAISSKVDKVAAADQASSHAAYTGTDPFVRARLGLPPLKH